MLLPWPTVLATAQEQIDFSTELSVDWRRGEIELRFVFPLSEGEALSPRLRDLYTRTSRSNLGFSFVDEFSRLRLNSRTDVGGYLKQHPQIAMELSTRSADGYLETDSSYSENFSEFRVTYRFPLHSLFAEPFIAHDSAAPPPPLLRYVPSGPFSGIVIYVEEELPVHGTNVSDGLSPALFPRVYSNDMELLAAKEMVAPEALEQWGMVGYYSREQIDSLSERVGEVPLYTKASALFGEEPTDLLIPRRGAELILSSEETVRLISEGKIAIVHEAPLH